MSHQGEWLDTHVHVSGVGRDGEERGDILPHLMRVLDAEPVPLQFVISGDFPWPGRLRESGEHIQAANAFIHDLVCRGAGRLHGACTVNPHFLDASLAAMDVCFGQWGFVMLGEMLQYIMGYRMDSPETVELVRAAVHYDVPVQVHISTSNAGAQGQFTGGGTEQLEDFLDLAERVPEAKYILAHLVGTDRADPPVVAGYLDQIEARFGTFPRNMWAEIRDFNSPGVGEVVSRVPSDRLLAGTDWVTRVGPPFLPYGVVFGVSTPAENPYPPEVAAMRDFLRAAGAGAETIARVSLGNAQELLRLT